MQTPSTRVVSLRPDTHLDHLDCLRGVAIFLVFIYHACNAVYGPHFIQELDHHLIARVHTAPWELLFFLPCEGWTGVALFFVISGFCIHLSHVKSGEKGFRIFFVRRFFRIYPPYLIAFLFFVLLFPGTRIDFTSLQNVPCLITHFLLIHNWNENSIYAVNGSFWSIAVEVQLYLIYPLLLWLSGRLGWRNCLILLFLIEISFILLPTIAFHLNAHSRWNWSLLSRSPFAYWFSWSIGAKIADDWCKGRPVFMRNFPLWLGPLLFVGFSFFPGLEKFRFTVAALSTAALIAALLSRPRFSDQFGRLPFGGHLRQAGLISYSAYLLHEPLLSIYHLMEKLVPEAYHQRPIVFILCLLTWPIILLVSWGYYRLIELPSIAWGKRVIRWIKSDRPVSQSAGMA
ncbi:MAG: acyltransferase [Methylacidiphilales bacterium]|nr:acyltransferase [Candidatus Methylacidiphilales bacterium]